MKPEPLTKDKFFVVNAIYGEKAKHDVGDTHVSIKDVKSACEFYLKYKEELGQFSLDYPEYFKLWQSSKEFLSIWLFKFAFKGVLE